MNDRGKLRILLPHWIEHNAEHAGELRTWAEHMQFAGETGMAQSLFAAAASLEKAGEQLAKLSDEIGR
jgi:nickel/cobalt exporter